MIFKIIKIKYTILVADEKGGSEYHVVDERRERDRIIHVSGLN